MKETKGDFVFYALLVIAVAGIVFMFTYQRIETVALDKKLREEEKAVEKLRAECSYLEGKYLRLRNEFSVKLADEGSRVVVLNLSEKDLTDSGILKKERKKIDNSWFWELIDSISFGEKAYASGVRKKKKVRVSIGDFVLDQYRGGE